MAAFKIHFFLSLSRRHRETEAVATEAQQPPASCCKNSVSRGMETGQTDENQNESRTTGPCTSLSVHRQRRWRQDAWCQQEKRDTMLQGEKSGSLLLSLIPRSWKAACAARQPSPVACRPHASQCLRHCSASERRRNNLSSSLPSHPLPAYTGSAHTHTRTHAGTHGAHHLTFASDSSIAFPFAVASLLRGIR